MKYSVLLLAAALALLATALLVREGNCQSFAGTLFNSSKEIENITLEYPEALRLQYAQQWLFPSIRFTTNGTILGWRFASADNKGRGTPRLNVWTPETPESDTYIFRNGMIMRSCITSETVLDSGERVRFHSGGLSEDKEGLEFSEGDIIGILFRSGSVADVVPYLYDTSVVNPFQEPQPLSYYLSTKVEKSKHSLGNLDSDTLLPVLVLDVCVTTPDGDSVVQVCMGNDSVDWRGECETPTTDTLAPTTTDLTNDGINGTLPPSVAPGTGQLDLMIVTVSVSAAGGVVALFIIGLLMVVCCCVCKRKRRRKGSVHTTDIQLETIVTNGVLNNNMTSIDGQGHTYDSLMDQREETPTFIVSIMDEVNALNGTANGQVGNNNVDSSVATYERPIFQYETLPNENHAYDRIRPTNNSIRLVGSSHQSRTLPELPPSYALHQLTPVMPQLPHPYGINSGESPLLPRTPMSTPPLTIKQPTLYNTLENGLNGFSVSPLVTPLTLNPVTHPLHIKQDSGHSITSMGSAETRYRLRSGSRATSRPGRTYTSGSQEPITPPIFFSLETGVYVPTQDQREEFGHFSSDSMPIFDDKVYACLSNAANSPFVNNWNFFEESESYWKPASDSIALYEQLSMKKYREILRKQIEITGHLGSGQFGKVAKGVWHTEQGDLDIAIKMLNKKSSEKDTVRFLQEAAIMGQFKHPNIVRLHGVVTVGHPVMIVLELMLNRDLRNYLKSLRPVPGEMVAANLPRRLLDFCSQIALGMEYLSRKDFVHRDLATRNILLTDDYVCKIADFGMSRDLDDEDYYMSQGGIIPIKWTAPEALNFRKYSTASDVWSFGVLVYEVWSLGHSPFRNKTAEETISLVENGHRLAPPPGCPRAIYNFMIKCWHPNHSTRPTFTEVVQALSQPDEELLRWTTEDSSIHPQATSLGAPLRAGEKLYPELCKKYTTTAD